MILLDTDVCIRVLNHTSASLVSQLKRRDPREVHLCSVVKAELTYGARHSQRVSENLKLLGRFFAPFTSLPFDDACADHYGMIRAELASTGMPVGPNDLLIAATARAHDLRLVTANIGEFSRVPGLQLEDWER